MQGDEQVVELLNEVLTAELTAVNQYFLDAKMFDNWGYGRLGEHFRSESIGEMKDADELIERILYLDGHPNVQRLGAIRTGERPAEKLTLALELEREAIERLNRGIALCSGRSDNGTRELLEEILEGEEAHADWLETQLGLIGQVGDAHYLAQQIPGLTMPSEHEPPSEIRSPVEHHPPVEEYLQTIEALGEEGAPVIQARIAERLGKSAPSVSEMLDRLSTDGYVDRSGRVITLTDEGRAVARGVIRKHRLAERLLVDVIGLPWHLVHEEAGRWEHVMSDDVEARLVELLGDPGTCPHGNPIPGSANQTTTRAAQVSLGDVSAGASVRFERLTEEVELDSASLRYLDEAGFIPGATATVTTRGPDGTVVLDIDGKSLALGRDLCRKLFVAAT